jgi:hypothetical protein
VLGFLRADFFGNLSTTTLGGRGDDLSTLLGGDDDLPVKLESR